MEDQKMDNLLNLAIDSTERERLKSGNLNVGYTEETRMWDIVIKYSGEIGALLGECVQAAPLLGGYAVVTLSEAQLESFVSQPQIEFAEMPKRLYFQVDQGAEAGCIRSVQREMNGEAGLSGEGVLIGVVDSGVDYRHPDFRREDGTSRILKL